jgi:hypothetical protein
MSTVFFDNSVWVLDETMTVITEVAPIRTRRELSLNRLTIADRKLVLSQITRGGATNEKPGL